ncbi:hypothetical protein AB0E27_17295 [Streptomyces sparsogenes]|uniref:hypothetical protein n=1 Tax=Streptomyces sparsogenes TaxID=67365 RepID=UPI0034088DC7
MTTASRTAHRGAWTAPLLSTLLTLPVVYVCSVGVGFTGMACDVGTSAEIK